ncbi:MAG TPA: MFS transporter [bacterium]|nr:MFS transporter [bacterium]
MAQPGKTNGKMAGFRVVLRTLRFRNYRLFFGGQGISLIGTWMQQVAMSWLVYRLTDSELMLGLVSFAGRIPIFLLAPVMGVLADRWDRHRILVFTQSLSMAQAFVLAFLMLTGRIEVWHLIALSLFMGTVNSLDIPARQSFIVDMIEDREDLGNAIALNSSMVNGARLIGPSIAGLLIAAAGEGTCFLINAVSYVAVLIALLAMKIEHRAPARGGEKMLGDLKEGARYVFGFPPMRAILLMVSVVSLMGMPYVVLMPVFARDVFHRGPHGLGFLMAAAGAGALGGAIYLAARQGVRGLNRLIVVACLLFGSGLIAFSLSPWFWLSLVVLFLAGFGMMVQLASSNTVLQSLVDDDKRGRLMSFYTMSFMGMAPFGSLLAGGLADLIGAPYTVLFGGGVCVIAAIWFSLKLPALRRLILPVYQQKGLSADIASAISMATEPGKPPGKEINHR